MQRIARVLSADQRRQGERDFLGGREAVLTVKDHAVAAIEHEHRGAGTLVLALPHLKVLVFDVERHFETASGDGREQRGVDVQVQRIAKLVAFGRPVRFNAGRKLACVVPAKAGLAERPQQVLQRLVTQEVEGLVGDLELRLALRTRQRPALAGLGDLARLRGPLLDRDVSLL